MITKQKYQYLYRFQWSDKFGAWICIGGSDMLLIGAELQKVLRDLAPDYETEIYNIINMTKFKKINFEGLRVYRTSWLITIEYERRCTIM